METRKVIDPNGKWFVNIGNFPMPDPESGTVFEPRTPTQAKETDWIKTQPTIQPWTDAKVEPAKPAEVKKPEPKAPAK